MKFKTKIKTRIYTGAAYALIGAALIAVRAVGLNENEMLDSFGAVLLVMGLAKAVQYLRLMKNEDAMKKREIAENDEMSIAIWQQARSLAVSIYSMCAGVAVIVLYALGKNLAAQVAAYMLMLFVLVYWVCYFAVKRKY